MPVPDLSCDLLGLRLKNPIILASGVIGTSATLLLRAAQAGAGAVRQKLLFFATRGPSQPRDYWIGVTG